MKSVRAEDYEREPGTRYYGQCAHVWDQGACACGATCERDDRGKISVYKAAGVEEHEGKRNGK